MERQSARELASLFLKLGLIAFGGPAAHIAMLEDEVVERRRWMNRQHFLDLVGATNLIPGPNSTEMTMHVGYERGGLRGLVIAGSSFIGPAVLLTGLLAWLYVRFGTLPQVAPFLVGVKPAVLAVILSALWKLGRKAIKGWRYAMIGIVVLGASLLGMSALTVLILGGVAGAVWLRYAGGIAGSGTRTAALLWPILSHKVVALTVAGEPIGREVTLWRLGLFFLKIGAVLYGSGYVLVAFLEQELVREWAWLTQAQLLDAIAIGQFTPGPVLSTATFIGYLVAGAPGAAVATVGIFLPSFIFVLLLNPIIPRLRQSVWASMFLDAVNVAAVALMAVVTLELGRSTLLDWQSWLIAVLAALLTFRFKLSAAWLVLGGAVSGYLLTFL